MKRFEAGCLKAIGHKTGWRNRLCTDLQQRWMKVTIKQACGWGCFPFSVAAALKATKHKVHGQNDHREALYISPGQEVVTSANPTEHGVFTPLKPREATDLLLWYSQCMEPSVWRQYLNPFRTPLVTFF